MARSNYIYLVLVDGKPNSAFTVKHEMESSLPSKTSKDISIFRLKDNPANSEKPVNITEEIYK